MIMDDKQLTLADIFKMQAALMVVLGADPRPAENLLTDYDFKQIALLLVSEIIEVMDPTMVSTKPWKARTKHDEDLEKEARSEVVDVFFMFIEFCLRSGISAEQLMQQYDAKWTRNIERAKMVGVNVDEALLREGVGV